MNYENYNFVRSGPKFYFPKKQNIIIEPTEGTEVLPKTNYDPPLSIHKINVDSIDMKNTYHNINVLEPKKFISKVNDDKLMLKDKKQIKTRLIEASKINDKELLEDVNLSKFKSLLLINNNISDSSDSSASTISTNIINNINNINNENKFRQKLNKRHSSTLNTDNINSNISQDEFFKNKLNRKHGSTFSSDNINNDTSQDQFFKHKLNRKHDSTFSSDNINNDISQDKFFKQKLNRKFNPIVDSNDIKSNDNEDKYKQKIHLKHIPIINNEDISNNSSDLSLKRKNQYFKKYSLDDVSDVDNVDNEDKYKTKDVFNRSVSVDVVDINDSEIDIRPKNKVSFGNITYIVEGNIDNKDEIDMKMRNINNIITSTASSNSWDIIDNSNEDEFKFRIKHKKGFVVEPELKPIENKDNEPFNYKDQVNVSLNINPEKDEQVKVEDKQYKNKLPLIPGKDIIY